MGGGPSSSSAWSPSQARLELSRSGVLNEDWRALEAKSTNAGFESPASPRAAASVNYLKRESQPSMDLLGVRESAVGQNAKAHWGLLRRAHQAPTEGRPIPGVVTKQPDVGVCPL